MNSSPLNHPRMKRSILLIIGLLFTSSLSAQLKWLDEGNQWIYGTVIDTDTGASISIQEHRMDKDTVLLDIPCKKDSAFGYIAYQEEEVIYFWNDLVDSFEIRYDFGAEVGDSWENTITGGFPVVNQTVVVMVMETATEEINGELYNTALYHSTYMDNGYSFTDTERVISEIGSKKYFGFPYLHGLVTEIFPALGCFSSAVTDTLTFSADLLEISCTGTTSTFEPFKNKVALQAHPNPAHHGLTLSWAAPSVMGTWQLCRADRQVVFSAAVPGGVYEQRVRWGDLPTGFYFWKYIGQGELLATGRLLIGQ